MNNLKIKEPWTGLGFTLIKNNIYSIFTVCLGYFQTIFFSVVSMCSKCEQLRKDPLMLVSKHSQLPQFISHFFSFLQTPKINLFILILFLFKHFIHLFLERGEGREKESERTINVWLPFSRAPYWGLGLQPRHVPWLGIEPDHLVCRPVLNPLSHTSQGHVHS